MEKNLFAHYMHRCCSYAFFPCLSIQQKRRANQTDYTVVLLRTRIQLPHSIAHKSHLNYNDRFMPLFSLYLFSALATTFVNIDVVNFWPHFAMLNFLFSKTFLTFRTQILAYSKQVGTLCILDTKSRNFCIFLMSLIIFQVVLKRRGLFFIPVYVFFSCLLSAAVSRTI